MSKFQAIIFVLFFFFCFTFLASSSEPKLDQDRFSGEYNPDSVYEYNTYNVVVLNNGEKARKETRTDKKRKTIYYENNLSNKPLVVILTILYFMVAIYILYRRKKYKSTSLSFISIVFVVSIIAITLVPTSLYSLTYNIKELYIRSLGIEVEGKVWTYKDRIYVISRGRGQWESVDRFYFSYIPKDSINRQFSGKYTQLSIKDLTSYPEGTEVSICLSKNGEEATIQLHRLQKENIINIIINSFILIMITLFYIGVFNKPLEKLSDKINFKYKKKDL